MSHTFEWHGLVVGDLQVTLYLGPRGIWRVWVEWRSMPMRRLHVRLA